ncbi:choice-of-anchor D domain-containing protein [Conexibacter stalactiti]|uniref:Choice-of-anchor D domain-containing protein n=1 Tax=Conexibacter stalactiti TaxID=1940611 RepID=A0ABU4HR79_9ACTN|nr:choice-of-anchor D domain-containing protein [Conexibacter stalactiti]MDW5595803.1 choice-of-anchor D domain-containing protein [Conexibacter stalactiti]MEC5036445.1 choice-of-anchor D domain-containing protein [Conexibacter stalactiti]
MSIHRTGRALRRATAVALSATAGLAATAAVATAAVTPSTLVGWGANQAGQLAAGAPAAVTTPRSLPGLSGVVDVAGGGQYTVALRADGSVWTWGLNDVGQLGDGTRNTRSAPRRVDGVGDVVAVATTLASTFALRRDGAVWAWGNDDYGQLGRGTILEHQGRPVATGLTGVRAIRGGREFALALREDGTVLSWGDNSYGQLGRDSGGGASGTPTAIPGLSGVRAVAAGGWSGYALLEDGTVRAWGYAAGGALGDPTAHDGEPTDPEFVTTPVTVAGVGGSGTLDGVSAISGGTEHALALRADGTVVGWGRNGDGELGQGAGGPASAWSPLVVPGLSGIAEVGALLVSSVARDGDGRLWTWGDNRLGRLGRGLGDDVLARSDTPAQLADVAVARLGTLAETAEQTVAIALPPATVGPAQLSFSAQARGTLSGARTVTVTAGFAPLTVKRVVATGAHADDFLIADDCAGEVLAPGESCGAQVRFSPSAEGARTATLVVRADEPGPLELPLSGEGGPLPQGPQGEDGPSGPQGPAGATGPAGVPGPAGALGPAGAAGPKGETGPRGATGPRGRDARVSCRLSGRRNVRCTVTYAGRASTRPRLTTRARLVRSGRTVARGTLGRLRAPRALVKGRAVLLIGGGSGAAAQRIVTTVR